MKIIDGIFDIASIVFKMIDKGNILSFDEINENSVKIAFTNKTIYGAKFQSLSNRIVKAEIEALLSKMETLSKNSQIMLNLIKTEKEFLFYIYSTNENFITSLINITGESFIKKLTGPEIIKSFADYFMYQKYEIKNNVLINIYENSLDEVIKNNMFHYIAQISAYKVLEKNDVYQMVAKEDKIFDIYQILQSKWKGVLSLYFEVSNRSKKAIFDIKQDFNKSYDQMMNKIYRKVRDQNLQELIDNTILMNAIFVGNEESQTALSTTTGIQFIKNNFNGDKIYKNTFFKNIDNDFSFFILKDDIKIFFQTANKKIDYPEVINNDWYYPDYWGYDFAGNFINNTFKKHNNPHTLIIGKTGSGKTTATGKILKSAMLFDDELNSAFLDNEMIAIRYFDIDYSLGGFFKKLKEKYPDKTMSITSGIRNFKFNILEFDDVNGRVEEIDKLFAISYMDMLLSILNNDEKGFSATEKGILGLAIEEVYKQNKYTPQISLKELEEESPAYYELIQDLYKKGYTSFTSTNQLSEEYDFLKKPTLRSVINYLNIIKNDRTNSQLKRDNINSLLQKLDVLKNLGFLDFLSNRDMKEYKEIFYLDATEIKKIKEMFVGIVWLFVNRLIKQDKKDKIERDKKGLPKRKIYYVFEEAHNFLSIPTFTELFKDLAKEIRKYGIELKFLIHRISDIHPDIYASVSTKIFLFKEGEKELLFNEINSIDKMTEERVKIFKLATSIPRGMFVIHSDGEDAMRLEISPKEIEIIKQEEF